MKLLCLHGNDPLLVLMPLQITRLFDGAYIIVDDYTEKNVSRILGFPEDNDDGEGPFRRDSIEVVKIRNGADYYEARQVISNILNH